MIDPKPKRRTPRPPTRGVAALSSLMRDDVDTRHAAQACSYRANSKLFCIAQQFLR
jgi:hypothetical protein